MTAYHNVRTIFQRLAALWLGAGVAGAALAGPPAALPLVPYPQSVELGNGRLVLSPACRIIAADTKLVPLAEVLSAEFLTVVGCKFKTGEGQAAAGEIQLRLDPALKGEAYTLLVTDRVLVSAGNYQALALGTSTMLQLLETAGKAVTLPKVTIKDEPRHAFRGLMIDTARLPHSFTTLRQCVNLCRLYKIRYLQLHLSDDQLCNVPSRKFPELSGAYSWEGMKEFVKYADDRGVTIIPEIEGPGHSGVMRSLRPDLFGLVDADGKPTLDANKNPVGISCFNLANPKLYPTLETLMEEQCELFHSSPYIHIGGDEVDMSGIAAAAAPLIQQKKFKDLHDLYCEYVVKLNEMIKKHGKRMIVWEGFGGTGSANVKIPTDIIVMEYEIRFNMPQNLLANGYTVINASWTPLYIVFGGQSAEEIYKFKVTDFGPHCGGNYAGTQWTRIPPDDKNAANIPGAMMCAWEMPEQMELPMTRPRVAPLAERLWHPELNDYPDFARRFARTDAVMDKLQFPFSLTPEPRLVKEMDTDGWSFDQSVTLQAKVNQGLDYQVRYSTDQKPPTAASPVVPAAGLTITEAQTVEVARADLSPIKTLTVLMQAFDGDKPVGDVRRMVLYSWEFLKLKPQLVQVRRYENSNSSVEARDLSQAKPVAEYSLPWFSPRTERRIPPQGVVLVYTGTLEVPADDSYNFGVNSHGGGIGSRIWVDGKLALDASGKINGEFTGEFIPLKQGRVQLRIELYARTSDTWFYAGWTRKGKGALPLNFLPIGAK